MRSRLISILIFSLFLLSLFTSCLSLDGVEKFNKYQEDLIYLYNYLAVNHSHFFNSVRSKEARVLLDKLLETVHDEKSLYFAALRLCSIAEDSHTTIYPSERVIRRFDLLPFKTTIIGGKLYITEASNELYNYLGNEIIEIASFSIDEVINKLSFYLPSDNSIYKKLVFNNLSNIADLYNEIGLLNKQTLPMVFLDQDKQKHKVSVPIKTYKAYTSGTINDAEIQLPESYKPSKPYTLKEIDSHNLLLQYNECREDMENPIVLFIQELKPLISGKERIIIDLRFNEGGNSTIFEPVIEMIAETLDVDRQKVIVLIGNQTFSSALLNAQYIKDIIPHSYFIGEPTGGSESHFGEVGKGKLPNSSMVFTYSTKYFDNGLEGPMMPDMYIPVKIEDLKKSYDRTLDIALSL